MYSILPWIWLKGSTSRPKFFTIISNNINLNVKNINTILHKFIASLFQRHTVISTEHGWYCALSRDKTALINRS